MTSNVSQQALRMLINCPECGAILNQQRYRCPNCDALLGATVRYTKDNSWQAVAAVTMGTVIFLYAVLMALEWTSPAERRPAPIQATTTPPAANSYPYAAATPNQNTATAGSTAPLDPRNTVYIGDFRGLYHRADCPRTRRYKKAISRQEALAEGLKPCPLCNP